jgi:hypothetical protein
LQAPNNTLELKIQPKVVLCAPRPNNTLSHTGEEIGDANVEMDVEVDSDNEADDLEKGTMEEDENEPWFDSIL